MATRDTDQDTDKDKAASRRRQAGTDTRSEPERRTADPGRQTTEGDQDRDTDQDQAKGQGDRERTEDEARGRVDRGPLPRMDRPLAGGSMAQPASQVRQALNELVNAKGQGNAERVIAAEKTLRGLGVEPTRAGIKAAEAALLDDRVKGRSMDQRGVDKTPPPPGDPHSDPARIPGGLPDVAAPDPAEGNDPSQAGISVPADSPEDRARKGAAGRGAGADAGMDTSGVGDNPESTTDTGPGRRGTDAAGSTPDQSGELGDRERAGQVQGGPDTVKTPGQGDLSKAATEPKPKGADAGDEAGQPAGKGPATTDKGPPEGIKGKGPKDSDKGK